MTVDEGTQDQASPLASRFWGRRSTLSRIREACSRANTAIFFAEDRSDWLHIGPLADRIVQLGKPVIRLTADPNDPAITKYNALFIGKIVSATRLFLGLPPSVVVMTMTDLDTYHLKRSVNEVHYVYVFHSLLSTHRAYRENAFDAYDSILCSGPHHKRELEKQESVRDLRSKDLQETGYCRLDDIIQNSERSADRQEGPVQVLLAPTWGASSLLEHDLAQIVQALIDHSLRVVLRFHPMSLRHQPDLSDRYSGLFGANPLFSLDSRFESTNSFLMSDVVLSDWSGAAHEFALGLLRPAVFIDTPKKANNEAHPELGLECYEDVMREDLGALVGLAEINQAPELIASLHDDRALWQDKLKRIRSENLYNPGSAVSTAADYIVRLLS